MYTSGFDVLLLVDIRTRTAVAFAKLTVGMSLFKYFSTDREDRAPSAKQPRVDREDGDSHGESTTEDVSFDGDQTVTELALCAVTTPSARSDTDCDSSKQSTTFRADWLVGRSWLRYDHDRKGMLCVLCQKYEKRPLNRNVWTTGPCKRIRLASITRHEESAAHRHSLKCERTAARPSLSSTITPALPAKGMEQAFACLYFMAKQRIPHTTNYEPLLDLVGFLGININELISVARNALYTSDKAIKEMLYVISEFIEQQILKDMKKSNHFSLMFDETTDCTVTEQLAIHGLYIEKSSGELKSRFLKVIDLLQPENVITGEDRESAINAGAETGTKCIIEYITKADLNMKHLRGIGTDGAATMTGRRNGVVARLKRITPSALGVHCAAHRLNLASTQAGDAVPYIKKFNVIIRQLFDFFDNSAVRQAGLKAVQTLLEEKGKLVAPDGCVERSVNRLKDCFSSVVVSLQREGEDRSDAKALGLNKLVCEFRFICTMLLMCDALPHVTRLSKCFQFAECDYSIIPKMLSTTITSLNQMKTVNGVNLNALPTLLDQLKADGIDVKKPVHLSERYFQDSIREPFLKLLIENIEKRFEDKSVLTAFSVFDPAKLPRNRRIPDNPERELLESQTIMNYGNTEIETLSKHFDGTGALGSSEICLEEWTGYRQFLRENENTRSHGDVIKHLCTNTSSAQIFPNMSALGQICSRADPHCRCRTHILAAEVGENACEKLNDGRNTRCSSAYRY